MKPRVLIIISSIAVLAVVSIVAIDSASLDTICHDSGGMRKGDYCLAPLVSNSTKSIPEMPHSYKTMQPNSMEYFYYPNPEDTENRDAFQKFILIRLPEELGGSADDVSSFRAYSALSVGDHCLMKYRPEEGRQRIEDPCFGSVYRSVDGLMIIGAKPVINTTPVALPYLDLSVDNGVLYVEPPVWTPQENGVVGIGRPMSSDDIRHGSQIIVDAYEKSHPNHPNIPIEFAGYILAEINYNNSVKARYFDFSAMGLHNIYLQIDNESAQDQKHFPNFATLDSEFWQIGDSVIQTSGSKAEFVSNGFKFEITGKEIEFIKKEIIRNYFPEYSYDEMFLVSSTVE